MGQPEPSPEVTQQAERDLAAALTTLVESIEKVQLAAHAIQATGGSPRESFLANVPEDSRPMLAAQWPMFAMMLGLPLT